MADTSKIDTNKVLIFGGILIFGAISAGVISLFKPKKDRSKGSVSEKWKVQAERRGTGNGSVSNDVKRWISLAEKFRDGFRGNFLYEDEPVVYEALSQLRDNRDAIEVAGAYADITGKNLPSEFNALFSDRERAKAREILNSKGITAWRI